MNPGCYTALVTPFAEDGSQVDRDGLNQLAAFQIENGITGILAVGTTGESPTLAWEEHNTVVEIVANASQLAHKRLEEWRAAKSGETT